MCYAAGDEGAHEEQYPRGDDVTQRFTDDSNRTSSSPTKLQKQLAGMRHGQASKRDDNVIKEFNPEQAKQVLIFAARANRRIEHGRAPTKNRRHSRKQSLEETEGVSAPVN